MVRRLTEPRRIMLPVIKSDAYGHGAVPVARTLLAAGADRLGLATVEEGIALREVGVSQPLMILGATVEDQAPDLVRYGLTPVVFRHDMATALNRAAQAAGRLIPVHVKIDTGMGRLGLEPEDTLAFVKKLGQMEGLRLEGVMTHLADTDPAQSMVAREQVARFQAICHQLEAAGLYRAGGPRPLYHVANSAALLALPTAWFDMIRPGLVLYGCYPSPKSPRLLTLKPVMTVKSRIVHLRRLPAGSGTGYNHTFITRRDSVIATVPIGYAHGYSRALSNRGQVEIRGYRAPVVGSISMDMTMVDVTEVEDVALGDEVVIVGGGDGRTGPSAEDLADAAGTIPHEVLCALGSRVARVYTS